MNKEFISKMMKAKMLEYEAIRTLLPENINNNMDEIGALLKESFVDCMKELYFSSSRESDVTENKNRKESNDCKEKPGTGKIRKVTIE